MPPLLLLAGFQGHELATGCRIWVGRLPEPLMTTEKSFNEIWSLHPQEHHEIKIHGRLVNTPRWQQAYGRDYHYTGRVNKALPVPSSLEPLLRWGQKSISTHLNGMLLNWNDAALGHYIGPHRDSTRNVVTDSPIVCEFPPATHPILAEICLRAARARFTRNLWPRRLWRRAIFRNRPGFPR